eukprot:GHVR01029332.1.p1 GENE.GHVR01029332.1~~GHVR01029332.1.p1  ORF type:complete len:130 (-),score=9.54 GHVR01029332.1:549-938(-)
MASMEERIMAILESQGQNMKRDMDAFKAEMLNKVGRSKLTPEEEVDGLTEEEAKLELKKLRKDNSQGTSPAASEHSAVTNPGSCTLLKELQYLKQTNEQIDRVTIGRITVTPASIASQVGGDMTLSFMS